MTKLTLTDQRASVHRMCEHSARHQGRHNIWRNRNTQDKTLCSSLHMPNNAGWMKHIEAPFLISL